MASETQTVGSESTPTPTPPLPQSDGQKPYDPLKSKLVQDANVLPLSATFADDELGAEKALRWCGITKYRARQILRAASGSRFLKLEIIRSVATTFELPTLEMGEQMLKTCLKEIKKKETTVREKSEMMRAFAAVVEQLRHLKDDAIVAAEKYGAPPTAPKPNITPVQVNVGINNYPPEFPPVAQAPDRAKRGATTDILSNGGADKPL